MPHSADSADAPELLILNGREVRITHPGKLYFSRQARLTKLDLVRYFLSVAPGALADLRDRPLVLKRYVNGAEADAFYQKRAPTDRPAWLRTVTLSFPSGRTAEEIVVDDEAGLAWIVNLGCIELHPHPVRSADLDHPDELRIDLDPGPGIAWSDIQLVALEVKAVLEEAGLRGWPKTSGSRGMHINVRIHPRWTFTEVRRAALALARAVERRVPTLATSKWWKEERHGVFLDYNQNAKDRTTAAAYSVRPVPDARVSAPLSWDEVSACDPADFTVFTMRARFENRGDPHAAMDQHAGSLDALLELAAKDEAEGLGDAPWPPHFRKMEGESSRVAPSRAKKSAGPAAAQSTKAPGEKKSQRRSTAKAAMASAETTTPDAAFRRRKPHLNEVDRATDRQVRHKMPLIVVARSASKDEALAGLDRWKERHPDAARLLAPDDVLVDSMRGRSSTWTRIRINLRHIPEEQRPAPEPPDPDNPPR